MFLYKIPVLAYSYTLKFEFWNFNRYTLATTNLDSFAKIRMTIGRVVFEISCYQGKSISRL